MKHLPAAALILALVSPASADSEPTLFYFGADWCRPCRDSKPTVAKLELAGWKVRHVDTDREPALAKQFQVDLIPAFVAVVNGREVSRLVGSQGFLALQSLMKAAQRAGKEPAVGGTSPGPTPSPAILRPSNPAVVQVSVRRDRLADVGSGTLIAPDRVITCYHMFRDGPGIITVSIAGSSHKGVVLKADPPGELVVLRIDPPTSGPTIPVAVTDPQPGDPITIAGFGQGPYREAIGVARAHSQWLVISKIMARSGDSGGPMLNSSGHLVGVLWGSADGETWGATTASVRRFLGGVAAGGLAGQQPATAPPPVAAGPLPIPSLNPWRPTPGPEPLADLPEESPSDLPPADQSPPTAYQPADLSPVLSRLDSVAEQLAGLAGREPSEPQSVDLTPILRRLDNLPAPVAPDLSPVESRLDRLHNAVAAALGNSSPDATDLAQPAAQVAIDRLWPYVATAVGVSAGTPLAGLGLWALSALWRRRKKRTAGQKVEADLDAARQVWTGPKRAPKPETVPFVVAESATETEEDPATPAGLSLGWSETTRKPVRRNRYIRVPETDLEAEAYKEAIASWSECNPRTAGTLKAIENLASQILHGKRVDRRMRPQIDDPTLTPAGV